MKSPEKPRPPALLLSLRLEDVSVPVFAFGALLVAVGGLPLVKFFFLGTAAGALATWAALRRVC
jgi:hypothetical protein